MLYDKPVLTPELVEHSFARHFLEIASVLSALQSGDPEEIAKIDDLEIPDTDLLLAAVHASRGSAALQPDTEVAAQRVDGEPTKRESKATQIEPTEDPNVKVVPSAANERSTAMTATETVTPPIPFDEDDIRGVVLKLPRGESAHAALKERGFIRDLDWLLHGS